MKNEKDKYFFSLKIQIYKIERSYDFSAQE
jgi:hypothetical protein